MKSHSSSRKLLSAIGAVVLAVAGTVLMASPASAAALSATTEAELATAITTANADTALDVITLGANITLTADLPAITDRKSVV